MTILRVVALRPLLKVFDFCPKQKTKNSHAYRQNLFTARLTRNAIMPGTAASQDGML